MEDMEPEEKADANVKERLNASKPEVVVIVDDSDSEKDDSIVKDAPKDDNEAKSETGNPMEPEPESEPKLETTDKAEDDNSKEEMKQDQVDAEEKVKSAGKPIPPQEPQNDTPEEENALPTSLSEEEADSPASATAPTKDEAVLSDKVASPENLPENL